MSQPTQIRPIAIRPVTEADLTQLCRLIAALLAELGGDDGPEPVSLEPAAAQVLQLGGCGFLAELEGQPIGALMLSPCAAIYAGGAFGEISELYVTPAHRSSGVARALIAAACAEGRLRGWKRLEVGAPAQPAWARSLAFYRREGFAEIGPRLRLLLDPS